MRRGRWLCLVSILALLALSPATALGDGQPERGHSTPLSAPPTWRVEFVANPSRAFDNLSPRSLAFDSAGRPHIVYGGDHLYHAWRDGPQWYAETVDPSYGVGRYASIAIGASDSIHVAYYDAIRGDLRYVKRHAGTWTAPWTVDELGDVGRYCSIALDPTSGCPRIAYYDRSDRNLKFATLDGIWPYFSWSRETVDSAGDVGEYCSVATEAGEVHVAYRDATNESLRYARWEGSVWSVEAVPDPYPSADHGLYTSIIVDEDGGATAAVVSHYDDTNHMLILSSRRSGVWSSAQTSASLTGHTTSLLHSSGGFEVIASTSDGLIDYPYQTGWQTPLTLCGDSPIWAAAAAYAPGSTQVCVTFQGSEGGLTALLRYCHEGAGSPATIDRGGRVGAYGNSLALDSAHAPHVAYWDADANRAAYARRTGKTWTRESLPEADSGWGISLAVDCYDQPNVSYCSEEGGFHVSYAQRAPGEWQTELVAGGALIDYPSSTTSLALSSTGLPRIALTKAYPLVLSYATSEGTSWTVWPVAGSPKGLNPSLKLDSTGLPHVAYLDEGSGDAVYAYRWGSPATWFTETVASAVRAWGNRPSLALAGAQPFIAYHDQVNDDLMFAGRVPLPGGATAWMAVTVDSTGDVGTHPSLAFDPEGRPHISYYDATNGDLKHAWREGTTWHTQVVDSMGDVGQFSSLAIDPRGNLHITYYDETNRALRYAWAVSSHRVYLPLALRD